jgi:hypothetical protein
MSDTASALALAAPIADDSPTTRRPALRVVDGWDDVPSGPVPREVIRYFEEANAREEARRAARALREHADTGGYAAE